MKGAAIAVLLLVAAFWFYLFYTFVGSDMPVLRKPPPNWGRSFPMQRSSGPEVQLVRLDLPQAADVTLYLNEGVNLLTYANLNEFHVSFGSGGTARSLTLIASVRGTVLHVVAATVEVRSQITAQSFVPDNQLSQLRVSAMAGLGRPYTSQRYLLGEDNPLNNINPSSSRDFLIDGWVTAAQITLQLAAAALSTAVTVTEIHRNPLGDTTLVIAQPVANYASPKVLNPLCNVIRVANGNAGVGQVIYVDLAETFLL